VQLELVDIWHFALSMSLQESTDVQAIAQVLANELQPNPVTDLPFAETLEAFVADVVAKRAFNVERFSQLLALAELPFDELFNRYVGKNVLNRFRQDHGYQEGTYNKIWQGKEDNEHLAEILDGAKHNPDNQQQSNFTDWLYQQLSDRYSNNI